jgi:FkbM family methyltransferase
LVYRRRLPAHFDRATFYVSPAAGIAYLLKPVSAIDPTLLRLADELVKSRNVIWDIGANVGLFAMSAAVRAGEHGAVFAFEPDVWLVQLLRRTSAIQPSRYAHVTVVPAAVASNVSLRTFSIAKRARASNALSEYGYSQMGGIAERQTVPTFSLNWLLTQLPAPDVIKIDVEGAELEVLQNQSRILEEIRPVIICEVGSHVDKITQLFRRARYNIYDGETSVGFGQTIERATWSTVGIPEEKANAFIRGSKGGDVPNRTVSALKA